MSRKVINNTPINSGLGDNLKIAFDKVNEMTEEIYSLLSQLQLASGNTVTNTSELVNDGESGSPFLTLETTPTTWQISNISGLTFQLTSITEELNSISSTLSSNGEDISSLFDSINTINGTIQSILSTILSQNNTISQINLDIVSIKERLNILES